MPPSKLAAPAPSPTSQRILDVAERLVQTRGFNGFSYADVASRLRITKASLHYHFPSKADLGASLVARYHAAFQRELDRIDSEHVGARHKLRRYVGLYADVARRKRLCLCGMLAADHVTLPKAMRDLVNRFFDANEAWLSPVLEAGRGSGALRFDGPASEAARTLVASLEGAMLVARAYGDASRFDCAAERLLAQLGAT